MKKRERNKRVVFELKRYPKKVPDEELIEDLKRVAKRLKKNRVTINQYDAFGRFYSGTLVNRFGSWFSATDRAGLVRTRNLGITDKEFLQNIEEVWLKLGKQPRCEDMHKPLSRYGGSSYTNRFGSWMGALEEFIQFKKKGRRTNASGSTAQTLSTHRTGRRIAGKLRLIVLKRDGFRCRLCGRSPTTDPNTILQVDHIKPWSAGGKTEQENLQTLCLECNMGKGNGEAVSAPSAALT
jgi:predicted restriction endonuclease